MSERDTGKTQRMLEAAVASKANLVFVEAHNLHYAADLCHRVRETFPDAMRVGVREIERDGRRIRFVAFDEERPYTRGLRDAEIVTDHFVWESR